MHTKEENLLYRERNNFKQVYVIYIVNIGISNPIDISKWIFIFLIRLGVLKKIIG